MGGEAVINRTICAARSAWYGVSEPRRLQRERRANLDGLWRGWTADIDLPVSVIIPTHNRCKILMERALPSVLDQTYRNIEILVCAHGCTDDTFTKVLARRAFDKYFHGESRIRPIYVPRRRTYPPTAENHWYAGPVDPINAGLKAARGKWIARIDDDDEWTPDHIEKLLRFAQIGNYEFVSSAYASHDKPYIGPYNVRGQKVGGVQTWLYRSYLRFMKANPDCWRKRWNKVNDTDLQDRMVRAGVRTGYLPVVTALVNPRPGENVIGLKAYQQNRAETEKRLAFK